ncbi:hypothetical protein [Brachybacterium alimentarium]|uniref:hypothetical protein n=1 Tax=Brachybacterium alimentarium TaxID=47845 RepID=UPI003FD1981D
MEFLGLGGYEVLVLLGTAIGVIAVITAGVALVKIAFWGPAAPRERTKHRR